MGKLLQQQRRGKGSPSYKRPSHRFKAWIEYRAYDEIEKTGKLKGEVIGFVDNPMHQAILMKILYDNGDVAYLPSPEGIAIGDVIEEGAQAGIGNGTITQLKNIPDGFYVFDIENIPGGNGKFVRAPGGYAVVMGKEGDKVVLKLPSKRKVTMPGDCRAQVGVAACGGKGERPMFKAGASFYKAAAVNRRWPSVRGVAMNSVAHPHGGKQHHIGKPSTVSRNAPPGAKTGHLAASRTGRRKR